MKLPATRHPNEVGGMFQSMQWLGFSVTPVLPGLRGFYWLIVPLVVVFALYFIRLYQIDGRRLTGRQKWTLVTLRFTAAALVLLMLLAPGVQLVTTEERLPVVALLLDE